MRPRTIVYISLGTAPAVDDHHRPGGPGHDRRRVVDRCWRGDCAGLGAFLWHYYAFRVRPLLVPRDTIRELVASVARQDDPEEAAFCEEQAAWYRGATFEQGVWRRVRRELRARGGRPREVAE